MNKNKKGRPTTYKSDLAKEYILKYSEFSTLQIAKILSTENPLDFPKLDSARSIVRLYRGELSKKDSASNPGKIVQKRTKEEKEKAQGWASLPESDYEKLEDFVMPIGSSRVLVLSDIHIPYHDRKALKLALEYGKEHKCNAVLLNGDTLDFFQLSRYIKDRRLRDFAGELELGKQFLESLKQLECPIYYKVGNHEERYENYLKTVAPELLGVNNFRLSELLEFGKYGVIEIKSKQLMKLGHLNVLHGHEFGHSFFSPVNAARGLYMRAKADSVIGHHHQTSEHSEKDLNGEVVTTYSLGCLCGLQPEYMPYNKWNHGFGFITFKPTGEFEVRNLRIINGVVK